MVRTGQSTTLTFSSQPYFSDRGPYGVAEPITERISPHSRPIVSYYFPKGVGAYHYGERHPMKPHRLTLTNALVLGYGLDKQIHTMFDPRPATQEELENYHDPDYVEFLKRVTPQNQNQASMKQIIDGFNCVEDCPIFSGLYDFWSTDIAINWSGGLHHAKRGEASGFCYVNDIVLAILEMLRYFPRVLYIDIDIHHGDGVELAFYHTNRVMTCSFHKYTGDFFPGTGKLDDNGIGTGKHFCLNVPLLDGIDDDMYQTIFKSVIEDTVTAFRPSAIVLQCGADSLGCDRLGAFNLSIAGHGECVDFVRRFGVPLLVLGGGGYTIKNVSRCWTYETSVLVGHTIPNELPSTVYDSFFEDSLWKLHPPLTGKVENQNSPASLQRIQIGIKTKLRYLQGAPSVMMQEIPPDLEGLLASEERTAEERDEERGTGQAGEVRNTRITAQNEFFEGENDNDQDDVPATPSRSTRGRGGRGTRRTRGRGTRGGRGRGRGGAAPADVSMQDDDEEDEESEDTTTSSDDGSPPVSRRGRGRPRGRPRARGRGRGRAAANTATVADKEDSLGLTETASMDVDE